MEVLGQCPCGTLSACTDRARIKTRGCLTVFITPRKSGGWIRDQGEEDTCHVPRDEPLLVFIVALLLPARPGRLPARRGGRRLREGRRCIASPVRAELVRRHRLTPVLTDRTANLAGHRGRRVGQGAGVPERLRADGVRTKTRILPSDTTVAEDVRVREMRTSVWVTNERDGLAGEFTRCARAARGVLRARRLCVGYAEMEMASCFALKFRVRSLARKKTLTVS